MPQEQPPGQVSALPPQRVALIRLYAAGPGAEKEHLRAALNRVGLAVGDANDPLAMLRAAGTPTPGEREVPALRLALGAMHVLADGIGAPGDQDEALEPVVDRLLRDGSGASAQERAAVAGALRAGARVPVAERWAAFRDDLEARGGGPLVAALDDDVSSILEATCSAELVPRGGEVVSRVETRIVVASDLPLDRLAPAVMPQNWPRCNDFFVSLTRRPDLDPRLPGATGGDLLPSSPLWAGVLEERVGSRPDGWFPDTNLAFRWDRQRGDKILLTYSLLPPVPGERTVLSVDQGFLEVQRLPGRYVVTTLKNLLIDEGQLPAGGQVLGSLACELGWLDHALNQFTACGLGLHTPEDDLMSHLTGDAAGFPLPSLPLLPPPVPPRPAGAGGLDAELQRALARTEAHLRQTTAETAAQYRAARERIRSGDDSLDAWVEDAVAVWLRGVRDSGRAVQNQALIARGGALMLRDLARTLTGPR